jgi:hypothetical protein
VVVPSPIDANFDFRAAYRSGNLPRRVAALIKTAATRLAERSFDPALHTKVLWSNFRSMGFCDSSDFSSLGISADDFADFFL